MQQLVINREYMEGYITKYAIVYSSKTGNTKMLAERLQEVLPKQDCLYCGAPDERAMTAERLFVGFWCDKGTSDAETEAFLKNVRGKEVYLFGTAGFAFCGFV